MQACTNTHTQTHAHTHMHTLGPVQVPIKMKSDSINMTARVLGESAVGIYDH